MFPSKPIRILAAISLLLALTTGCGGNRPYTVLGAVKFKDGSDVSKLAGYLIMLEGTEPGPNGKIASATGDIQTNGTFQLSTNGSNDGAYSGKYKIAITPPPPLVDAARLPSAIPAKYHSLTTSGLEVFIAAEDRQPVTIELEPLK